MYVSLEGNKKVSKRRRRKKHCLELWIESSDTVNHRRFKSLQLRVVGCLLRPATLTDLEHSAVSTL